MPPSLAISLTSRWNEKRALYLFSGAFVLGAMGLPYLEGSRLLPGESLPIAEVEK